MILMQLTEWNKVIQTDLTGTFITCQIVGKNMIKSKIGRILSIFLVFIPLLHTQKGLRMLQQKME